MDIVTKLRTTIMNPLGVSAEQQEPALYPNCAAAADEIDRLRAREDKLLRAAIDATWGEALEDGSVPATKKQDWIIAYARAVIASQDEQGAPKKEPERDWRAGRTDSGSEM